VQKKKEGGHRRAAEVVNRLGRRKRVPKMKWKEKGHQQQGKKWEERSDAHEKVLENFYYNPSGKTGLGLLCRKKTGSGEGRWPNFTKKKFLPAHILEKGKKKGGGG